MAGAALDHLDLGVRAAACSISVAFWPMFWARAWQAMWTVTPPASGFMPAGQPLLALGDVDDVFGGVEGRPGSAP